ncbi:unnamed protein product [Agarophyton chilense]
MKDGSSTPIVRRPLRRPTKKHVPLPAAQEAGPDTREFDKLRVAASLCVLSESQMMVKVTSRQHGLRVLQPLSSLYERHSLAIANGIVHEKLNQPFHVLIANVGTVPQYLVKNQVIGCVMPHPIAMVPTKLTAADVLGLVHSKEGDSPEPVSSLVPGVQPVTSGTQPVSTRGDRPDPVQELEDLDLSHVPESYRHRLQELLRDFTTMWYGSLGDNATTEHRIDLLPDTRPISQHPYRAGPAARAEERAQVDKMLLAGVSEPAQSPWASPVVLAPKQDGYWRFCVDYRRLNADTVKDVYPIPRMDEYIDSLGTATVFKTLEANWGYWQVPVRKQDQDKTAFACHSGLYRFKRMPFGLTNAPATFQRSIDILLDRFKWRICLVYLDDIIVFSDNMDKHLTHVRDIMTTLRDAGVTLKLKKCDFFTDKVKYLGHVIRLGLVTIEETCVKSLKEAKEPRTQTELRSFLGLANVYRRFIPHFADKAASLNALLRKGQPPKLDPLTPVQTESFNSHKDSVVSAPILSLPKPGRPFTVDTDASDYQVGCALLQTAPNRERRPVGYWSRSLNVHEKNYSVSEKECLAVVWALQTLRPYLMGNHFTVFTDHASLRWLLSILEPSGRLMRWRLRLAEFDFDVQYRKGSYNTQADALSRLVTTGEALPVKDDEIPCFAVNADDATIEDEERDTDSSDSGSELDDFLLSEDSKKPLPGNFVSITPKEMIQEQFADPFCAKVRAQLDGGGILPFQVNDA